LVTPELTPCAQPKPAFHLFSCQCLCLTPQFSFACFLFFLTCWSLLGLRYRWDIAISMTGQGQFLLLLSHFYASFMTSRSCRCSLLPLPLVFFCCLLPLTHVLLPIVFGLQHLSSHRAVCVYPSMYIPYSISRCSLTLYGAHAGYLLPVSVIIYTILLCYDTMMSPLRFCLHFEFFCTMLCLQREKWQSEIKRQSKSQRRHVVRRYTVMWVVGDSTERREEHAVCDKVGTRLCVVRHDGKELLLVDLAVLVEVKFVYHCL